MLLRLQDFETRQYDPTTWLRTKVTGTGLSDFTEASGRLKSFVKDAQKNTEGLFVPETCYGAVRSGRKHHPEDRKKNRKKNIVQ